MWREQYKVKAKKASKVANVILGLDRFVGTLPAWDLRTLYMARVDPYLTAGCEVCLDVEEKSLKLLEKVQLKFLRRMLGVGSRAMKAILFSETGIWPIRYRRVYLALKNLCYWIGLDQRRKICHLLKEEGPNGGLPSNWPPHIQLPISSRFGAFRPIRDFGSPLLPALSIGLWAVYTSLTTIHDLGT
jgi:hypothetical protein